MLGHMRPTQSTYARRLGARLVTVPKFPLWRCDFCGYTRYDTRALAQLDVLLTPEADSWDEDEISQTRARPTEGPANRGPRRWSS